MLIAWIYPFLCLTKATMIDDFDVDFRRILRKTFRKFFHEEKVPEPLHPRSADHSPGQPRWRHPVRGGKSCVLPREDKTGSPEHMSHPDTDAVRCIQRSPAQLLIQKNDHGRLGEGQLLRVDRALCSQSLRLKNIRGGI